jgi:hypothetical protein
VAVVALTYQLLLLLLDFFLQKNSHQHHLHLYCLLSSLQGEVVQILMRKKEEEVEGLFLHLTLLHLLLQHLGLQLQQLPL